MSALRFAWLFAAVLLSGCASTAGGDGFIGKTLETLGLKAPKTEDISGKDVKALLPVKRQVTLRMHAADQLNTDRERQSLSVVARVFKLRRADAFRAAPYGAFGDAAREKATFGDDVIEVREVVMRPGQKHDVVETVTNDTRYLAVVALFRAPAPDRWRFVFDAGKAETSGITLGLHGCAISIGAGVPERAAPETWRLAGVRCE